MRSVERNGWKDCVNCILDKLLSISMFEKWMDPSSMKFFSFFKSINSCRFRYFFYFYSEETIVPPLSFDFSPRILAKRNSTALNGFVSNSTSPEILLSFGCLWIVNLFNEFASLAVNQRKRSIILITSRTFRGKYPIRGDYLDTVYFGG